MITAKVKSALVMDSAIRAKTVTVETTDAVVTLKGDVASAAAKQKAEHIAAKTQGVKRVNNQLIVKP